MVGGARARARAGGGVGAGAGVGAEIGDLFKVTRK